MNLRIGLSSDLYPTTVSHALARRDNLTAEKAGAGADDKDRQPTQEDLSSRVEGLRNDLKIIMRNLKLRGLGNGRQQAASYNANVTAEVVAEHNDVFAVDWVSSDAVKEDVLVGERAERLDCFSADHAQKARKPWKLFHPIIGGHLNLQPYLEHYGTSSALQALLNDVRAIWTHAITSPREGDSNRQEAGQIVDVGLGIAAKDWHRYNVILVIPDIYVMAELEELVRLLLEDMGFAGILIHQEGVCATFGAGLSSSCVVHLGGDRTTISCVEEGLIVAESRIALNYGGRDISRFFMQLLKRANFPYQALDMDRRLADYWLAEQLKERLCTLDASQLGLIISDFYLRLPKQKTKKFSLRTYDEIVIAPMALFSPRAFALDEKKRPFIGRASTAAVAPVATEEEGEEGEGISGGGTATGTGQETGTGTGPGLVVTTTAAMSLCVRHLLPPAPAPAPAPSLPTLPPGTVQALSADGGTAATSAQGTPSATPAPVARPVETLVLEPISLSDVPSHSNGQATPGNMTPAVRGEDIVPTSERTSPAPGGKGAANGSRQAAPTIDIPWEASKVPLDFAVWNSIQASIANLGSAGTSEERVRRMTANIICTGGTAHIPAIGFALEARLNNYLSQWYTNQGKDASSSGPTATVVPPPRDMDPRLLAWKGMSVLARLDSAQEMWIPRSEWLTFGARALKEKSLFL